MTGHRLFWRRCVPHMRSFGCLGALVLASVLLTMPEGASAQTQQDIRCMQLQQELAAARGGGRGGAELAALDQQIAQQDRIYQGARSAIDGAGCYERMLIFGRALKRTPRCLQLNDQVENARRHLARLQEQRKSLARGGGNQRRQAELQQALKRNGCSGAPSGGLFDFFGGPREPEYQTPIYRSINPNGRYRSVCVRLCDGFYYPVSYSNYGSRLAADAETCQQNCAAPAELYVYRNPGGEIEQAISLSGSAYMDLPVALRYRKEFVDGCSCKKDEYNPKKIEAANKKKKQAEAEAAGIPAQANAGPAGPTQANSAAGAPVGVPQLNLDITGATPPPAQAAPQAAPVAPPAPPPAAQVDPQGQSSFFRKPAGAN